MPELTLETLAARIAALEQKFASLSGVPATRDWRSVVGMFEGSEFSKSVDAEVEARGEAQRRAAQEGTEE